MRKRLGYSRGKIAEVGMINKYPIQTEDFYNRWLEEYRKRIGGGE